MYNEAIQNLLTRRSIRAFQDTPVEREKIDTMLQCATYAPSAMNRQTWHFVAVLSPAKIRKLAKAMGEALGNPNYNMYCPAALIITSNEPGREADNACAMQNIMLAAHAMGVGSVWINQLKDTCDDPAVRAILTEFGVPAEHTVFGVAALGYAAGDPRPADKKYPVTIVED